MTEFVAHPAAPARQSRAGVALWLVLGAAGFVLLYFCTDVITSMLASAALPLPNVPAAEARAWFAGNRTAAVMMGLCQLLSVAGLAAFVHGLRLAATGVRQATAASRAQRWGLAAVALMACSSVLTWVLAAVAPTASSGAVAVLRTATFIAGGTAHVVALGLFVLLASRLPGFGRALCVLAWFAFVPAVASLASLVVFEGAALILIGRLLAMVWIIAAAVTVAIRLNRGRR